MTHALASAFNGLIASTLGLRIRQQDQDALWRSILARVDVLGLSSPDEYYRLLTVNKNASDSKAEWLEFAKLLTVTESYFFRDQGQIQLLKNCILPELIKRKRSTGANFGEQDAHHLVPNRPSLKIWSAGCSTGEEAYSIAILIEELLLDPQKWNIVILGTDINPAAFERARQGIYSNWSFRSTAPDIQEKYFRKHKHGWEISPHIRSRVTFQPGNLMQDRYPNPQSNIHDLDLILCRNVFIYFEPQAIALVLSKFHEALAPQGYLMTGHAELHGQNLAQFEIKNYPQSIVYQRRNDSISNSVSFTDAKNTLATSPSKSNFTANSPLLNLGTVSSNVAALRSSLPAAMAAVEPHSDLQGSKNRHLLAKSQELPPFQGLLREAETLIAQKAYARAIHTSKQLIALEPKHFQAYCLMAEAYANLGDHANAAQVCQQALQLNPMAVEPHYLLAQVQEEQGNREGAKASLKRIIYLAPASIHAYLELGSLYQQEGNLVKAQTTWRSALTLLKQQAQDAIVDPKRNLTAADLQTYVEKRLQRH